VTIDVDRARFDTPGCRERIHFNNAGASLMPTPVIDTVIEHLELETRIGGYEAADQERDRIENTYRACARLINCRPEEIALLENATRAWDAVFYALPFRPGDRIVTGRIEYSSNFMAYLHVARERSVEIIVIGEDAYGQIDLDELRESLDDRVKLISLTHVPTNGGLVNPAEAVGELARETGTLYLLDACQSVGQLPVDVNAIGCDFLATTGRKFIRGPRGTGFLYVNRTRLAEMHPHVVQVGSAAWTTADAYALKADARRFETWEVSYALQLGLGRAVDYSLELGVGAIWCRVAALGERLRTQLMDIDGIAVHDRGKTKCGIVTFTAETARADELLSELRQRSINVEVLRPQDARLDFESRQLPPLVRASVHYFNRNEEIDDFCNAVRDLSRARLVSRP